MAPPRCIGYDSSGGEILSEFPWSEAGRIAGLKVFVSGKDKPGSETLVLPSGLAVVTENALPAFLNSCSDLDPEHLLCLIAEIAGMKQKREGKAALETAIRAEGGHPGALLRDHQLALILKTVITCPGGSHGHREVDLRGLARLCKLITSSQCEADRAEATSSPASLLMRMAYQQFWDMEGLDSWPRGLIILREMATSLSQSDRYDLNASFSRIYGLAFDSFVVLSFALFALVINQPGRRFGVDQFTSSPDFDLSADEVEKFLGIISCSMEEYRDYARNPATCLSGYDLYNLNPLIMWPGIRHSAGGVVVPIPRLLLDRVTTGIYYDFLQRLPGAAGQFGNFWGKAFEQYVFQVFDTTSGVTKPIGAQHLVASGRNCDWALISEEDRTVVLIECKTRGLSARAKITGHEGELRKSLLREIDDSSLAGGVAQLAETTQRLSSMEEFESFRVLPILVTLDEIYLANFDAILVRSILIEGATKLTDAPIPDFQVCGVNGVEAVCRAVEYRRAEPFAALTEKFDNEDWRGVDMRNYISSRFDPPAEPIALHREYLRRGMADMIQPFRRQKA